MVDADRNAIDALAAGMYAAFCNRDGRVPDLDGLREVFLPGCAICKAIPGQEQVQTLEEFIGQRRPLLTQGRLLDFAEWETDSRTWIDGNVAGRRSLYAKSGVLDGIAFRTRGAKQMQFVRIDGRWWISALAWDDARDGFEPPSSRPMSFLYAPAEYLRPWKLLSLAAGIGLLVAGSIYTPAPDWDIPVSLLMAACTYLTAPCSLRALLERKWRQLPVAAFCTWFSVDGGYAIYWHFKDPVALDLMRSANAPASLSLYVACGGIWLYRGTLRELFADIKSLRFSRHA